MNERNTHLYKYIPHFILQKDLQLVVGLRDRWRDIYSERGLHLPISSAWSQGVPTLAPPCKLVRDKLIGWVSLARLRFSPLCPNMVITWSPPGYTPVRPECPDALSSSCLQIKMWQLAKALGVTWNEPKIHFICYIKRA